MVSGKEYTYWTSRHVARHQPKLSWLVAYSTQSGSPSFGQEARRHLSPSTNGSRPSIRLLSLQVRKIRYHDLFWIRTDFSEFLKSWVLGYTRHFTGLQCPARLRSFRDYQLLKKNLILRVEENVWLYRRFFLFGYQVTLKENLFELNPSATSGLKSIPPQDSRVSRNEGRSKTGVLISVKIQVKFRFGDSVGLTYRKSEHSEKRPRPSILEFKPEIIAYTSSSWRPSG